ncbi:MAG: Flp pilus assembly complex ATPase component TadA [Clostridiales bacterium]|uniref:CpaF family protein n=1 Tax=Hornefia butyriciproducens TaxID=2652293 RepID=UPI002A749626|nr:ATPase, T2SS/T4P/T4SS family [Hornefia butyriciproducens]MCI7326982.1 Flp pilus assembly complex ATPase component TadA [Clostridiales bacterium]MCI7678908.1 Flp pilus assembly complex ATPase component TadA [Clostridiales bacterium]MDY2990215.1 ATPase, T2SS/T4P/T4SS family [Hornefia butyriciproducens]MDY5463442.1 ATPase, T2SS/T4P/T4SS family [Hornefia butyriciproducens]
MDRYETRRRLCDEVRRRAEENAGEQELQDIIESVVLERKDGFPLKECGELIQWLNSRFVYRLGVIQPYIENEEINEVMVNGIDRIFLEDRRGIYRAPESFESEEELEEVIRFIAASVHREITEMNPVLDARLSDGSRVNAVLSNVALDGPVLTIRKFSREHISMRQMVSGGMLTAECAEDLRTLVRCGYNVFVSGGTSSGKTTFLNALADAIPKEERVIIIEDSRELNLEQIPNLVQMECRNANSVGKGKITMEMLIRTSLRMRPDRIIVGEVRGAEVADMLQAMNTGHSGSMSTGHGNSVSGMLRRLEAMYLMSANIPMDAIRAQIVEGIDIMVHLVRNASGARQVMEISELIGFEGGEYVLNPLYVREDAGGLRRTSEELRNRHRLALGGKENAL